MKQTMSGSAVDDEQAALGQGTSCTLSVGGMDCSSCAESVNNALRSLEGVQDVRVDVMGGKVTIEYATVSSRAGTWWAPSPASATG